MEPLRGLARQAANQIHVDALKAGFPQPAHHPPQLLHRHHPVHRPLHLGIGVLDAEADAVEAQGPQVQGLFAIDEFRVDLNRGLQIGRQIEMVGHQAPELALFLGVEVIGRTAAPVHLGQAPPLGQQAGDQLQLLLQGLQVGGHHRRAQLGGDAVAAAIPTGMAAEGHMHVERKGLLAGAGQLGRQIRRPDTAVELGRRGVAGVAGHRLVVFEQQL